MFNIRPDQRQITLPQNQFLHTTFLNVYKK